MAKKQPQHLLVSEYKIREIFNNEGYLQRIISGHYTRKLVYDKHRNPPLSFLPFCTHSQRVAYYDGSEKVAEVHQYLKPDGTIGASGLPDPKELLHDGIVYHVQ
jgi:hypothetical protein